jgi:hypothetical protein
VIVHAGGEVPQGTMRKTLAGVGLVLDEFRKLL